MESFELSDIDYEKIKYVVLIAQYKEKLVIIRNKNRTLWELPGGKREQDELLLKAASRELFEETGATKFELTPYGIYYMNGSYGMNVYAKIEELGQLPEYEIAEIQLCDALPDGLNYGAIYYRMYEEWSEIKKQKREFVTYKINYSDTGQTYEF